MDYPKFIVTKPDGRSHLYIKGLYAIIKYVYLMSWPEVLAEDGQQIVPHPRSILIWDYFVCSCTSCIE